MIKAQYLKLLPFLSKEWIQATAISKKSKQSKAKVRKNLAILKDLGYVEHKIIPSNHGRSTTGIWRLKQ